jgi:hypothetical protein
MYKTETKESYLENDFCWIWISDGILFLQYKPRLIMGLEVSKQIGSFARRAE